MTEELKPCPFCGGEAELDWELDDEHGPSAWVTCTKCKAEVRRDYQPDAITAWNTRLSRSAALIEALEKIAAKDFVSADGEWAVQIARSTLLSMRNNGHG